MAIYGVPATAATGTGATTGPAELIGAAAIEAPAASETKTGATEP